MKQKNLVFAALIVFVQAQPNVAPISNKATQLVICILFLVALAAFVYWIIYDRRQNYTYCHATRAVLIEKWSAIIIKIRQLWKKSEKNEKLGNEEQMSTEKTTIGFIQSQKSYIYPQLPLNQQALHRNSSVSEQLKQTNLAVQSPQINLKEVFRKNQSKEGKKSRSKLKNRIQIKKSQLESQDLDTSQAFSEEMDNSLDNSEG